MATLKETDYMSHASCRNILIDLFGQDGVPAAIKGERKVAYRIEPATK